MASELFPIDRDAEKRVEAWLSRVKSNTREEWNGEGLNVTIASSWGIAGGDALAVVLGKQVGFDVWDRELISAIASEQKYREAIWGSLDDTQRPATDEMIRAALTPSAYARGGDVVEQIRVAAALAAQGRSILLELGANYLVPGEQALHVRLVPTFEEVIPHHVKRSNLDRAAAEKDLEQRGQALHSFVHDTFGRDLTNPGDYDIVLNSATLNLFDAVKLCILAYESKFRPGPGWWYA